jgi:hypothetical protein
VDSKPVKSQVWIPVGELEQAFEKKSNILPQSKSLEGTTLRLYFENGRVVDHRFETFSKLLWREVPHGRSPHWTEETYMANEVRKGIFFVDFIKHLDRATTVTLALDLNAGIFTAIAGQLPTPEETKESPLDRVIARKELTSVEAHFVSGSINKPYEEGKTPRHKQTDELIGKRIEYTYSPTERYEHVYLNSHFYTWHCLAGAERTDGVGLTDTDRCHYLKLGENLYLFSWQEKIIPTHGVVIVDLERMRSSGKIFGYEGNDLRKLANFPVGSKARVVSQIHRKV